MNTDITWQKYKFGKCSVFKMLVCNLSSIWRSAWCNEIRHQQYVRQYCASLLVYYRVIAYLRDQTCQHRFELQQIKALRLDCLILFIRKLTSDNEYIPYKYLIYIHFWFLSILSRIAIFHFLTLLTYIKIYSF